jgi:hypothetical protein
MARVLNHSSPDHSCRHLNIKPAFDKPSKLQCINSSLVDPLNANGLGFESPSSFSPCRRIFRASSVSIFPARSKTPSSAALSLGKAPRASAVIALSTICLRDLSSAYQVREYVGIIGIGWSMRATTPFRSRLFSRRQSLAAARSRQSSEQG